VHRRRGYHNDINVQQHYDLAYELDQHDHHRAIDDLDYYDRTAAAADVHHNDDNGGADHHDDGGSDIDKHVDHDDLDWHDDVYSGPDHDDDRGADDVEHVDQYLDYIHDHYEPTPAKHVRPQWR
jgi:hypothetical protein